MDKLVVFDVDGTLRTQRSPWRHIHEHLGVIDKASGFYERYKNGEIGYAEWVRIDAELWKGVHRDKIVSSLEVNPIRSGAQSLVDWFRQQNYDLMAISTGVDVLNSVTCSILGIPVHISNELLFDDSGFCNGQAIVHVTEDSKADVLREYIESLSKRYNYIVAVGDSENDVPLFEIANDSVAILPTSETVGSVAGHCVREEPIDSAVRYLMR